MLFRFLLACHDVSDPVEVEPWSLPSQGLRYRFGDDGSAWVEADRWSVVLQPVDRGRASDHQLLGVARAVEDRELMRFDYPSISSWYLNEQRGLEQGFDLLERPPGEGRVEVRVVVRSDLEPSYREGGVDFMRGGWLLARYEELVVVDHAGEILPSELELDCTLECMITLAFDDTDAVYPVTIDPLMFGAVTELGKVPGPPADGHGGTAGGIALDGSLAVAFGTGDVETYRFALGVWSHEQSIVPTIPTSGPVAADGNHLAVTHVQGADVFEYDGSSWTLLQTVGPGSFFGANVSMSGGFLALGHLNGFEIFEFDGTQYQLRHSQTVAGFANTVVKLSNGRLATYKGGSVGFWEVSTTVLSAVGAPVAVASNLGPNDIALDGTRALIGTDSFVFDGTNWVSNGVFPFPYVAIDDALDLAGDRAIVAERDTGTLTLFKHDGTYWVQGANHSEPPTQFGMNVALQTDRALVQDNAQGDWILKIAACPAEIIGNGVDEDCDGFDAPCNTGTCGTDIIISEMMISPVNAVVPADGVWLELTNLGTQAVDLLGAQITVDGSTWTLNTHTVIPPNAYYTFGSSTDMASNGGAPVKQVLPGLVFPVPTLSGPGQSVPITIVSRNQVVLDTVSYTLAHSTGEQSPAGWSVGASLALDATQLSASGNDVSTSWCDARSPFGNGDFGSPGLANAGCSFQLDLDIDYLMATPPNVHLTALNVMFGSDRRFVTGNAGAGTFVLGSNSTGQFLRWTYDSTGVEYGSGVTPKAFGSPCFPQGTMVFPGPTPYFGALSGMWDDASCP